MVSLSAIDLGRFGVVTAREPAFTAAGLPETLRFCAEHSVQMLIARCDAADLPAAQAMEAAGGRIMDTLVYWGRDLSRAGPAEGSGPPVRALGAGDAREVGRVSAAAFRGYFGHYHADPRLDRAQCDAVYASWAERSCSDPAVASKVLGVDHEGRLAGFLTLLRRGPGEQEIVLNGVDPAHQRHGLYRALVAAAIQHARADGAARLIVSTQLINVGVQKTWARLGFELERAYYTFHLWRDEPRR